MANETDGMFPPAVTDPFPYRDHNADQVGAAVRRADHLVRYLIQVWGGVEPELYGPFASDEERDEQAKELFGEEHTVFKMYLEDGVPSVETYSGGEVDELSDEVDCGERAGDGNTCHERRGGKSSGSDVTAVDHPPSPTLDPAKDRHFDDSGLHQVANAAVGLGNPDVPDGRGYFKTVYEVVVLSDEPHEFDGDLHAIACDIDEGPCVGDIKLISSERVHRKEMDRLLVEVGSDPGFFSDEDEEENDLPA